jgi:hypothetical protein
LSQSSPPSTSQSPVRPFRSCSFVLQLLTVTVNREQQQYIPTTVFLYRYSAWLSSAQPDDTRVLNLPHRYYGSIIISIMSEGGLFAWKLQTIRQRGPAANYSNMSLPHPPKGQHWVQDLDTREWYLTEIKTIEVDDGNDGILQQAQPVVVMVGEDAVVVQEATVEEEPVPGVVQHSILPTDTFQGICLKYRLTPTELRRANGGFSGTNLSLVPNPLRIPVNQKYRDSKHSQHDKEGQSSTAADKMRMLQRKCPSLHKTEAKCYLELNDWSVEKALENAHDDGF